MRKGFTLVECMVAGTILVLVTTSFMKALSVINRIEYENAQYMEADAIVWDAIAESFNREYASIPKGEREYETSVRGQAADLHVNFDGELISAWISWNGQMLSNAVTRSEYARGEAD